jgi:hypothetical protein
MDFIVKKSLKVLSWQLKPISFEKLKENLKD